MFKDILLNIPNFQDSHNVFTGLAADIINKIVSSLDNIYVEYNYANQIEIENEDFNPYESKSTATFYLSNGEGLFSKIGFLRFVLFSDDLSFEENFDKADEIEVLGSEVIGKLFNMADQGHVFSGDIYLDTLDIEPDFRRQGYATILMNWLLALASYDSGKLFLTTPIQESKRASAYSFYHKFLSNSHFNLIQEYKGALCFIK